MDYGSLLDTLINKAGEPVKVNLHNYNSAQAALRRALKKYNTTVDAMGIGTKYGLTCSRRKDDGLWELTVNPLDDKPKTNGASYKFVVIDEAKEVSDDDFDWSIK